MREVSPTMSKIHYQTSPLARLVLFMVCLALFGSIVAVVHYYAVELPDQQRAALQMLENAVSTKCKNCQFICSYAQNPIKCLDDCDLIC